MRYATGKVAISSDPPGTSHVSLPPLTIVMRDQPRCGLAAVQGHDQGVDAQLGPEVIGYFGQRTQQEYIC